MAIVGIDLDGTEADWDEGHDRILDLFGADSDAELASLALEIPRSHERTVFDLNHGLTDAARVVMARAMDEMSYRDLRPLPGAVEGTLRIAAAGHDVVFVSTPWTTNPTCASDKVAWVVEHFGPEWAQRVILTSDKTLVQVDYLIDDRGTITGRVVPSWTHVVFGEVEHNRSSLAPLRMTSWAPAQVEQFLRHVSRDESASIRD